MTLLSSKIKAQDSKYHLSELEKYITSKEWRIKSLEIKDGILYIHYSSDYNSFPILDVEDKVKEIYNGVEIHCKEDNSCINWMGMNVSTLKLDGSYNAEKLAQLFNNVFKAYRDEKNGTIKPTAEKPKATQTYQAMSKVKVLDINMNDDWNSRKINSASEVLNKTFTLLKKTAPNKYGTYDCDFLGRDGKLLYLKDVRLESSSMSSESDLAFNTQQYPSLNQSSDTFLKKGTYVVVCRLGALSDNNIDENTANSILGKVAVLNKDVMKSSLSENSDFFPIDITLKASGKKYDLPTAVCAPLQPITYTAPIKKNTYTTNEIPKGTNENVKKIMKAANEIKYKTATNYTDVCSFFSALLKDYPNNFNDSYLQTINTFATLDSDTSVYFDYGTCRFHLEGTEFDEINVYDFSNYKRVYTAYLLKGNTSMEYAKTKYHEYQDAILKCSMPYGKYRMIENPEKTMFKIQNKNVVNPGYSEKYKDLEIMVGIVNKNEVPELLTKDKKVFENSIFLIMQIK